MADKSRKPQSGKQSKPAFGEQRKEVVKGGRDKTIADHKDTLDPPRPVRPKPNQSNDK